MTDSECVDFLQWALPQLGLRWPGFRKVQRQVHKRISRRGFRLGMALELLETEDDGRRMKSRYDFVAGRPGRFGLVG
jgi:hypothetical protein